MGIECRPFVMACCLILTTVGVAWAESKDLGRFGKVYPITEPNLIEELKNRTPKIDLNKIRQEHERYQPSNMVKLPKARQGDSFLVDMTYTLDRDVTDAEGNVLYKKGVTINPMTHANFNGGLVVIDGSDRGQVEWFKATPYFRNKRALLLISDGFASQLVKELERPVYYLTTDIQARLKLRSVPSVVVSKGDKLTVKEVNIEKE